MSASTIDDPERIGSVVARSKSRRCGGSLPRSHGEMPDGGFVNGGLADLDGSRWETAS